MTDFLINPAVVWLYKAFFWAVFAFAAYAYWNRKRAPDYLSAWAKRLIKLTIGFYVLYAVFLTWGQYYLWSQDILGKVFLNSPVGDGVRLFGELEKWSALGGSWGYFIFYSASRFWLNPLIAVLVAFAFYALLKLLKKHKERFFEEGESELGFLCALLAGWPGVVVFVPLVFLGVVLVSVLRMAVFGERYTTLGYPFLVSLLLTLIFGDLLIRALGLKVLYI